MTIPRLAAAVLALSLGVVLGTSADVLYSAARPPARSLTASAGQPGKSATNVPSTSSSGVILDAAGIAAKVDPAVVDIYAVLADGSGQAAGTGMVITGSGEVLTNYHVIAGASSITAQDPLTGRAYSVTVVGADKADDVAVIQLKGASKMATIAVGDASRARVGDSVVAIGNALGRGGTPTPSQGVIAGLGRTITAGDGSGNSETLSGLIQVRAMIQPGDSGGPLVNEYGDVIGMDTAAQVGGARRSATTSTSGFAIPINTAISIAQQLESGARTVQAGGSAAGA